MDLQRYKAALAAAWVLAIAAVGFLAGATSVPALVVFSAAALLPPVVMLRVWQDPGQSVSESIHQARR